MTPALAAPFRLAALSFLATAVSGCIHYAPAPLDAQEILRSLDALEYSAPDEPDAGWARNDARGMGARELAAFAVMHHPALAEARARVGVSRALLAEAGLLPDPEFGWDAMDVIAAEITADENEGIGATRTDYWAGLGLSVPLLAPGERDAKTGAAAWRVEEALRGVLDAEWALVRDVHLAVEDVLEAEALLELNTGLIDVAQRSHESFRRAREAGAVTAIQANLAESDLLSIRADRVQSESQARSARHRLNALLGLPPSADIPLAAGGGLAEPPVGESRELVDVALRSRPDLAVLLARFEAVEQEVQLEVARQFPRVSVGTGITIVPGLFSAFNRPAVRTALARRERLAREIKVLVHEIRRDVNDAYAALAEERRVVEFLEAALVPNAEESLRLTGEALEAGEVTVLEILTLQRALVDARTRHTRARAELARRHWLLRAAAGTLLPRVEPAEELKHDTSSEGP